MTSRFSNVPIRRLEANHTVALDGICVLQILIQFSAFNHSPVANPHDIIAGRLVRHFSQLSNTNSGISSSFFQRDCCPFPYGNQVVFFLLCSFSSASICSLLSIVLIICITVFTPVIFSRLEKLLSDSIIKVLNRSEVDVLRKD